MICSETYRHMVGYFSIMTSNQSMSVILAYLQIEPINPAMMIWRSIQILSRTSTSLSCSSNEMKGQVQSQAWNRRSLSWLAAGYFWLPLQYTTQNHLF